MRYNKLQAWLFVIVLFIALFVSAFLTFSYLIFVPYDTPSDMDAAFVENPGEYKSFTFTGIIVYENVYEGAVIECQIPPLETYVQHNYYNFVGYEAGWRIVENDTCSGFAYKP